MTPPAGPVVFDCDGTLVATQQFWDKACAAICSRYGMPLIGEDRHTLIGLTVEDLGRVLARRFGRDGQHARLSAEIYDIVAEHVAEGVAPLPGAVELIAELAGRRPLAVASNTRRRDVVGYLSAIGLVDAFDVVVGADDVDRPKPDPDVYLEACRRLGVAPATAIAVEDSPTGVAAARAAGMYVIGVQSSDLVLAADAGYPSLADPRLRRALRLPGSRRYRVADVGSR